MNRTIQKALVLGLGESGEAAAELLAAEGWDVTVVDRSNSEELCVRAAALEGKGVRVLRGVEVLPEGQYDVAIVSPGIPLNSPWLAELRRRGVPFMSELELGWRRRKSRVVAVTGSNGKSTAVKWLAEALERNGWRAAIAGNYGRAVCRVAREEPPPDWWVVEVSSFQLETVVNFRAEVGVLLNVLPNHLDRHGSMEAYRAAKARLFANATEHDACIVPWSLAETIRREAGGRGRWITFGAEPSAEYRWTSGKVLRNGEIVADLTGTWFDNEVLGPSAAAVAAAFYECGGKRSALEESARDFQPLPHRLQRVAEANGVVFINDSKATNLAALMAALRVVDRPVRLIAGGLPKEHDWSEARPLLAQRVRAAYLIGAGAEEMARAWSDATPCRVCGTLERAVEMAAAEAQSGEAVLLAPACTSFDQFRDYAERGERFMDLVRRILGRRDDLHCGEQGLYSNRSLRKEP